MTHFNKRCRERGIRTADPDEIFQAIVADVRSGGGGFCEHVMTFEGVRYWRFECVDGMFYAITGVDDPFPRTVITQEILRKKKWVRRMARRRQPTRQKRLESGR